MAGTRASPPEASNSLLQAGLRVPPVRQLLLLRRPSPASSSTVSRRTVAVSSARASATMMVVVRLGHHLVGGVLPAAAPASGEELLEGVEGGQDQGELADQQGLDGDEPDGRDGEFAEEGELEPDQTHDGAHVLLLSLLLPAAALFAQSVGLVLVLVAVFGDGFDEVSEGAGRRGDGGDDVAALEVDLDGVGLEEALQPGEDHGFETVA